MNDRKPYAPWYELGILGMTGLAAYFVDERLLLITPTELKKVGFN